jgi:parvulin-like peptidyl-prolyl isomerase
MQRSARRLLGALLCLAAAPAGRTAHGAPATPAATEVVARVNGRPVLRRDFDLAVQVQFRGRPAGVRHGELKAVREMVLEGLIDNEILFQKAGARGTKVTEKEVETEVRRLQAERGSGEAFSGFLKESGISLSEFRDQVRRSLVVTRFVDEEVVGGLKIAEEDVRRYYDQNPKEMIRPESVRLSQIVAQAPAGSPAERAQARERIEAILKEIQAGRDFADAARKYSDGPEAGKGGEVGFVTRGSRQPAIERAAFQMQPGETSDVIETRSGFHVIRVGERRPEGPVPFEEARETIRAKLTERERDTTIRDYVTGLKEKARVERLLPGGS